MLGEGNQGIRQHERITEHRNYTYSGNNDFLVSGNGKEWQRNGQNISPSRTHPGLKIKPPETKPVGESPEPQLLNLTKRLRCIATYIITSFLIFTNIRCPKPSNSNKISFKVISS